MINIHFLVQKKFQMESEHCIVGLDVSVRPDIDVRLVLQVRDCCPFKLSNCFSCMMN